jgi:hypothetical protein
VPGCSCVFRCVCMCRSQCVCLPVCDCVADEVDVRFFLDFLRFGGGGGFCARDPYLHTHTLTHTFTHTHTHSHPTTHTHTHTHSLTHTQHITYLEHMRILDCGGLSVWTCKRPVCERVRVFVCVSLRNPHVQHYTVHVHVTFFSSRRWASL